MMNANRFSVVTLFVSFYLAGYAVAIARASPTEPTDGLYCSDRYGYRVQDGVEYMPEDDPCKKCQCQSGFPVMCRSVQCSPPTCSMYESLKNECCEFRCIQPSLDVPKNNGNGSSHIYPMLKDANSVNLSIRLVASAVTSLLIFALLIFMIHRLRQRRLLISMRRLNNDRRSVNDGLAYMTNIDQLDIGFEFPPYEDPPPPYSPPKPTDDIPTEAPPPYELTSGQMETEPIEIVHSETNEAGSGVGETTDDCPLAESAAVAAVMLLGNTRWMGSHSLRPLSALEPFQPELIELSQPILDSKSARRLSSPVLTGQKRNEKASRCQSHGFTNSRQDGEQLFNGIRHSVDSNRPAPSEISVNHSASNDSALKKRLAFRQMKFDSSTPQLLLKMQSKLAHSSLPKHTTKATSSSSSDIKRHVTNMYTECPTDQHLFSEAPPLRERSIKNLNVFETMCDLGIDPLNVGPVKPEVEEGPNETRVKHLSSFSNWAECRNSLMPRSEEEEEEVSLHLKSSQVLCADPRKEKKPQNFMKTKDKSKTFLCNSSFLKKPKHPSRPQSSSGLDFEANTKRYSSMVQDLTDEHCIASTTLTKKNKKTTKHPSSCLFVHLLHDEDGSSCNHEYSNAAKTQMHINESATILNEGNSLQPLTSNDQQSDFDMTARLEAAKQPVPENTMMAIHRKTSQNPVGIPSPAQVLLSPDSPIYQQFLRSESITSQASFYSICSETGEKKHTKSVLPKGLTVQGTMSTGSAYLSPEDTSMTSELKEDAACNEKMDSSVRGMEIADVDNCIAKESLRNMTISSTISTSVATPSLPVHGSQNQLMSDWKVKEDHSNTNGYDPSTNKMKIENRSGGNSNNLPVTLVDAVSFSSSKCLRELPYERMLECDQQLNGTKLSKVQSCAQRNIAESKGKPTKAELNSNASGAELNYPSCEVTVKPAQHDDKGHLMFKDQLIQGVKDLAPGHKKHCCNRCKEHSNIGKKQKSKQMESFEYLVSRILQQLETSHFDDIAARQNTVQKVQRPRRFGHKSYCCSTEIGPGLSAKSVAKQSRPISLPYTKNSRFIMEGNLNTELANLDLTNRNICMLDPVENDNDGRCQQLRDGDYEAEGRTDGCHSSGTPVSVGL